VSTIPGFSMNRYGVYGEETIIPAAMTVTHPNSLRWEHAAAIWMPYMTAYGALVDTALLTPGDAVIITAASSSVGLAAIQIANAAGAVSIATTRTSAKRGALLSHGAHHVIATQEQNLVEEVKRITGGKGARITFDPVAGEAVETLAEAAAPGGIIILYGALASSPTPFPLFPAVGKGLTLRGYPLPELVANPERMAKGKQYVLEGLESGKLKPVIAKTFAFDKIVDAHRFMESNEQIDKIVVTLTRRPPGAWAAGEEYRTGPIRVRGALGQSNQKPIEFGWHALIVQRPPVNPGLQPTASASYLRRSRGDVMRDYRQVYIDGAWVDPQGGDTIDVISPVTERPVGQIASGTAGDVDRAVEAARRAFRSYSRTTRQGRIDLLGSVLAAYAKRHRTWRTRSLRNSARRRRSPKTCRSGWASVTCRRRSRCSRPTLSSTPKVDGPPSGASQSV
jgi:NADPH2:quinone reductase